MPFLSNEVVFNHTNFTSQAATTDLKASSVLDLDGYEGVLATVHFPTTQAGTAASADDAGVGLWARYGTASASGGLSPASGTFIPGLTTAQVLDIYRPPARYVQFLFARGGASQKVGSVVVMRYGARVKPTTNTTTIVTVEQHASPATGQA